jgi:hypothetical protein
MNNWLVTKNCVVPGCGKPRQTLTCHVHHGNGKRSLITAGWCPDHAPLHLVIDPRPDCEGCIGEWQEYMGVEVKEMQE